MFLTSSDGTGRRSDYRVTPVRLLDHTVGTHVDRRVEGVSTLLTGPTGQTSERLVTPGQPRKKSRREESSQGLRVIHRDLSSSLDDFP